MGSAEFVVLTELGRVLCCMPEYEWPACSERGDTRGIVCVSK